MRVLWKITILLVIVAILTLAGAAVLYVTKDWLVEQGVRAGIREYNARLNSRLTVQDISFDLLTLTVTARGVAIAARGQVLLEAPIYVRQATAKIQLWPLLRRHVVLTSAAVTQASVRVEINRDNRVNLEDLFQVLVDENPGTPSPWNVGIEHFTLDQMEVKLALEKQPVRSLLTQIGGEGSFLLTPLHVHAVLLEGQGEVTYRLGQERLHYDLSNIMARADVFKKRLVVEDMRVEGRELVVTGRGGIDGRQVAATFDAEADVSSLTPLLPRVPPTTGTIALKGVLTGGFDSPLLAVTASGGRVDIGPYTAANLRATLTIDEERLQIEQGAVEFARGTIRLSGQLPLQEPHFDVQVEFDHLAAAQLLRLFDVKDGVVDGHIAGHFHMVGSFVDLPGVQAVGRVELSPPSTPSRASRPTRLLPLPLALRTAFRIENHRLNFQGMTWTLDGVTGQLAGTLGFDGATNLTGTLTADLAAPALAPLGLSPTRGEARLTFGMRGDLPTPHVELDLQSRQLIVQGVAVEQLRLLLEADQAAVKIRSLAGIYGGGRFQFNGMVRLSAPLHQLHRVPTALPIQSVTDIALRVEGVQLDQLAPLLPKSLPVSGELSLQAQAAGAWPEVRGDGEVTFRGLMVRGEPMGDVVVMGAVSPAQLTVKRLVATVAGGQVQAQGMAMLRQRMVDIAVTWQGVQLGRIAFLQDLHVPISGALSGHVRARGIWPNLRAEVAAEGPQLRAYGLEIADLQLAATGSRHELTLDRLSTRIAGARLVATGHAAIGGAMELRLSSEEIPLRGFALLPQGFPLEGRVKLDLTGSGTLDNPTLQGQVRLLRLRAGQMAIGTGTLNFALDDRQLTYTTANLQNISLDGSLSLAEGLPVQARLAIRGLDLGLMSAQLAGTPRGVLEGEVAGIAEVGGRLRDVASLHGHLTLNRLLLRSSGVELQNASALQWQLAQGVLRFEAVRLQGQGTALTVRGVVHLPETRLDVTVVGTGPVAMVGARIPGVRFHQGVVEAQVKIGGTLRVPVFDGQTLIRDGAIYIAAINENLSQLQGEIQFARQTIAIRSLHGELAGGHVEVAGEVRLRGFRLHDISLTGQVKRVRLRYPTGFFARLDAELVVTGNGEHQQLSGAASLAHARYRRDIDLASLLRQYRQRALEPPSTAQEGVRLDIRVSTQDPLRVESRLAKLRATPALHVRGSLSRPVVLGRVDIEEGTADVGGTRFTAIAGSIDFLNPMRTEPFFDITADSRKNGYQIHVIATGTPRQFDLNLTSEPALAETDILALLTVGATGQAITAGVGTVMPQRLSSFLTGQMAAEVSRGVGGIVGIDRLDIEPVVGDAQRVGGPKITLGKDVSRDLSVTYSTIVGSTQADLVTVEYRLTDSISILGIRDERGDVGVDVKFSFRFE